MVMRFQGGGVGHTSTRDATNHFLADRHPTDSSFQRDTHLANEEPRDELDKPEVESNQDPSLLSSDESADGDESAEEDYGYGPYDDDDDDDEEEEEGRHDEEELDVEEDDIEKLGYAQF
jgi:hypothetical protein